jgi:hypothetical protein
MALLFIFWGSFMRLEDPIHIIGLLRSISSEEFVESILCRLDKIIVGALGAGVLIAVALLLGLINRGKALPQQTGHEQENA